MFADTLDITYNAVTKTLSRVNGPQGYASEYYLNDGLDRYTLKISHGIPGKDGKGESHLIRLDRTSYSSEGVLIRTASAWTVIKTFDGVQDDTVAEDTAEALVGLTTAGNIAKLVNRES